MNVVELINNPPKIHLHNGKPTSRWRLADEELLFLDEAIVNNMKTIETGAGVSTILFALKNTEHTCIAPDDKLVERIKVYCDEHGLSYANINFVLNRSEYALPQITAHDYDLALIDGRHGFPAPFIDWFYISGLLKLGGILVIDDIHIWTCDLLKQFLLSEEGWSLSRETFRAAIFIKNKENTQHEEWTQQPFVLSNSRASLTEKIMFLFKALKWKFIGPVKKAFLSDR